MMTDKIEQWIEKAGLQNSRKIIMADIIPQDKREEWNYWEDVEYNLNMSHTLEEAYTRISKIKIPSQVKETKESIRKHVKKQYLLQLKQYKIDKIERGLMDETCWWYKK
tara:strand:+ start:227 stop:553 length:327 start_codon:yes stop_codon:yes gene_type:complete